MLQKIKKKRGENARRKRERNTLKAATNNYNIETITLTMIGKIMIVSCHWTLIFFITEKGFDGSNQVIPPVCKMIDWISMFIDKLKVRTKETKHNKCC